MVFYLLVLAVRSVGCLFGGVWSRECLFGDVGLSGKVCQVALGQEVACWVLWLSVCLCLFKRFSVWNVGLSD